MWSDERTENTREAQRHTKSSEKSGEIGLPEREDRQHGVQQMVLEFSRAHEISQMKEMKP